MIRSPLTRKHVAIYPAVRYDCERHFLASIAELYPVDFVRGDDIDAEPVSAAIFFPEAWEMSECLFQRGVSCFRFAQHVRSVLLPGNEPMTFSDSQILHPAFRGATVQLGREIRVAEGIAADGHVALARHNSTALWLFRTMGGVELHTSGFAPPEFGDGQLLWSQLEFAKWEGLLPLMHFLRRVTASVDWQPAPPVGCFIFDDPNLHSLHYGYLDFGQLLKNSELHNYHVAIATVPLDALYAAPKAIELFRNNRKRLSLLIHGNSHVKNELAREYDEHEAIRVLSQALRRVGRFEHRTGLSVARVMAPPHGGCSHSVLASMLRLPLEGVCTMASSLVLSHSGPLPLSFGVSPTWFMAGGIPIVGRWDLRYGLIPLRLAAFLDQPVIPYGHHQDCAEGVEGLASVADAVNRWEPRTWMDMASILRGQYRTKVDGELMHIELRSRSIHIRLPQGVSHAAVYAPVGVDIDAVRVRISSDNHIAEPCGWGVPVLVNMAASLEITMIPDPVVDPSKVRRPPYRPWAPVRRSLSIVRDRMIAAVRTPTCRTIQRPACRIPVSRSGVALTSIEV